MILRSKIYFFSILTLLTVLNISSGQAQTQPITDTLPPVSGDFMDEAEILPDLKMLEKTHPEKITFSQYKLANDRPDFDAFAEKSPLVQEAQDIDRSAMILFESNRISNNFNLHNEKQPLVIHTMLNADEYSSLDNAIVFDELDDKTFFRFRMYGYNVGIVPDDIQDFSRLKLSPSRADILYKNQRNSPQPKVMAEFVVLPEFSDRQEPIFVNEEPFWLMFAPIVEVRLWSSSNPDSAKLVWYYRADDYTPADSTGLDGLYTE